MNKHFDSAKAITVESVINAPMGKVWDFLTRPEHIVQWAFASDAWEAPAAENDVRVGEKFKTVMAAKSWVDRNLANTMTFPASDSTFHLSTPKAIGSACSSRLGM